MRHRTPRFSWLCTLATLTFPAMSTSISHAGDQTNVLFIICDDLNCDLSCYGHPLVKSPNIDALAAQGVRFENAFCQYTLCGPSRASFMTGLYPDQTLVRKNSVYIREHLPNVQTMSQLFRNAGYTATRVGKIFHYNVPKHIGTAGHDDPYSWNNTFNPEGRDVYDEDKIFSLIPGSFGGTLSWLAADGTDEEQTDGIGAMHAEEMLHRFAANDTPFFLAVGLFRPHTPYVAPQKYFDMYPTADVSIPAVPDGYLTTLPRPAQTSITRKNQQGLSEDLARQVLQAYYASITFADAQVGRILDALRDTGLDKNTVVVFTSDHGYHMGEHGHYQKTTLFNNAARVPLVIAGPGVTATGETATTMAEMVDFYPTLAELTGLEPPKYLAGTSLVPALRDADATPRTSALTQYATGYSLRTAHYRYTEWGEAGNKGQELYDHRSDPGEMQNLANDTRMKATMAALATQLQARVQQHRIPPQGLKQLTHNIKRSIPRNNVFPTNPPYAVP